MALRLTHDDAVLLHELAAGLGYRCSLVHPVGIHQQPGRQVVDVHDTRLDVPRSLHHVHRPGSEIDCTPGATRKSFRHAQGGQGESLVAGVPRALRNSDPFFTHRAGCFGVSHDHSECGAHGEEGCPSLIRQLRVTEPGFQDGQALQSPSLGHNGASQEKSGEVGVLGDAMGRDELLPERFGFREPAQPDVGHQQIGQQLGARG